MEYRKIGTKLVLQSFQTVKLNNGFRCTIPTPYFRLPFDLLNNNYYYLTHMFHKPFHSAEFSNVFASSNLF